MTEPLLATKLHVPPPPRHAVSRAELLEYLDQATPGQLILLSAPAGFGKTTLISQWLEDRQEGVAWIALDEGDNDPRRFLSYLVACLEPLGIELDEALLHPLFNPNELASGALATTIINKIHRSKREIILVLDDYHVLTRKDLHELVAFFVENMPPNLCLVIATRADPALPLAKLRAGGQLIEIRADALRFDEDQTARFLIHLQGLDLSSELAAKLQRRTEGWVAGLQLASLALKQVDVPRKFVEQFSGSHQYIADYLSDEVIDGLSPQLQHFLLHTCLFDRFCAELCDAVLGTSDSQAIIQELRETNSFLLPLDEENGWFRYHQLFADLLRRRAAASDAIDEKLIFGRASLWFAREGFFVEAIEAALRAESFEAALDLAAQVVERLMQRGETDLIMNWVDQIPEQLIPSRPIFALIVAWIHLVRNGDTHAADSLLAQIAPENEVTQGKLQAIQSVRAIFAQADPAASENHAREALDLIPAENDFFRPLALWNLSAACYLQGKHAEGLETLHEVVASGKRSGNMLLAATALCRIGSVAMQTGDLVHARHKFEEALTLARDDEGYVLPATFAAKLGLGKIFWEWNRLDEAIEQLQDALNKSIAWNANYAIEAYDTLASLQAFSGDLTSARASLEEARRLAAETEITHLDDAYIESQQVLLELRQGNNASAAAWSSRKGFGRTNNGQDEADLTIGAKIIRIYELMVLARLHLAENRAGQAQLILDSLEAEDNQLLPLAKRIEYAILRSLVNSRLDRPADSKVWLQRALEWAQPGSYLRPFLEEGPQLYALLKKLRKEPATLDFHEQVRDVFESKGVGMPDEAMVSKLIEPLTKREQEVLAYLQSDLTVPEIADELVIAESTVRSHIKNLYGKLDAHSRYEAVVRAREFDLL